MTLTGINIRFLYLICGAKYGGFSSVQVYPKSYCIQHKTKRYSFHPYRLMFIFCQHRQHSCRMAFSLLESVRRIAPPVQTILTLQTHPENCYISRKTKAVQFPPIPLDVYFLPTQTARLPQGVFSTRICALNYFTSVKPIRKAATFTKSKAVQFPPIPLDVYFLPTQTARLPHGVFSTRICASNRSANADTWEIIPTMQS